MSNPPSGTIAGTATAGTGDDAAILNAQEAVRRAKEIAARLSGQTQVGWQVTSTGTTGNPITNDSANIDDDTAAGSKRKRWGVMPAIIANQPNKIAAIVQEQKEVLTRRVWVSVTEEKPAAHFVAFGNRKITEIIKKLTGKEPPLKDAGTEDTKEDDDQDDTNNNPSEEYPLLISFQGKGSNPHKPPLPGMPEEPLHARIRGFDNAIVQQAADLMEECLQEATTAETDREAVKAAELALTVSLDQRLTAAYRPASVSSLIHALPADKLAAALLHGSVAAVTREIQVPNGLVGFVIGRGGENIARMQAQTGCKVQIQKEHELQPGQTERIITLSAATEEAVQECENTIRSMVAERTRALNGGGNNHYGHGGGPPAATVELDVPDADVGLIIGKMGATIKSIQEESGANIQVPKTGNANDPTTRTLIISHTTEDGANKAKQLIENVLRSKIENGPSRIAAAVSTSSIQVHVPDKDVGLCIGRQGCVIKHMQSSTGTRIQIPPQANPGEMHRVITVSGSAEGCASVQQMLARIIAEQSSVSVMSGNHFQASQPHLSNYQGSDAGQQGYSAEWAAYHAAQEAAQQQQVAQLQQQQAAQHQLQTQQESYYEQFHRYAYYYGEDAARQYYGAWSPPPGTPNPYGINPNGIAPVSTVTPTPAAAVIPAPTPAPSSVPGSTDPSLETSRRRVSNLPAWMTQK